MAGREILNRLNEVFCDVFDDSSIAIHEQMTAADISERDLLNHINLIVAVEKRFKVKFTTKEIMTYANVGEFANALETKLAVA